MLHRLTAALFLSLIHILFNVNTRPAFRRKGLAEAVVRQLLQEAKAAGAGIITLDYTKQGKPLYEKLGFEHAEHDMQLIL